MRLRDISLLLKFLPVWSIATIVVCICYVAGLFQYPGAEYMMLLGVSDYIALSLPALPVMLLGGLGSIAMWNDPEMSEIQAHQHFEESEKREMAKPPEDRRWNRRTKHKKWEPWVTLAASIAASLYLTLTWQLDPSYAWVSFIYLVIAIAVLSAGFFAFAINRNLFLGSLAIVAFSLCGAAYSAGLFAASRAYTAPRDVGLQTTEGDWLCVNIIALTDRGPIYTSDGIGTEIASWSFVRRFANVPRCVLRTPDAAEQQ